MTDHPSSILVVREQWQESLAQLRHAQALVAEMAAGISSRQGATNALESASESLRAMASSLETATTRLAESFDATSMTLAEIASRSAAVSSAQIVSELDSLGGSVAGLAQQFAEHQKAWSEAQSEHAHAAAHAESLNQRIKALVAENASLQSRLQRAEAKSNTLEEQLRSARAEAAASLRDMQASLRKAGQDVDSALRAKQALESDRAALLTDLEKIAGWAGMWNREQARQIVSAARRRTGA